MAYMKLMTWLASAKCLEVMDFKPDTCNTTSLKSYNYDDYSDSANMTGKKRISI